MFSYSKSKENGSSPSTIRFLSRILVPFSCTDAMGYDVLHIFCANKQLCKNYTCWISATMFRHQSKAIKCKPSSIGNNDDMNQNFILPTVVLQQNNSSSSQICDAKPLWVSEATTTGWEFRISLLHCLELDSNATFSAYICSLATEKSHNHFIVCTLFLTSSIFSKEFLLTTISRQFSFFWLERSIFLWNLDALLTDTFLNFWTFRHSAEQF